MKRYYGTTTDLGQTIILMPSTNKQRGATAIEFAIVFSLLFGIFWATISYALPFFLNQVMNHAVAEGARFAVRADPDEPSYETVLQQLANERILDELSVLPPKFRTHLVTSVEIQDVGFQRYLIVTLTYPSYGSQPIVPVLNLPGLGPVPNLPGDLRASSRLRLPSQN